MGARAHEVGDPYRGTEPPEPGRGGQATATQHSACDRVQVSIERWRLFPDDVIDMETVTDIFIGAAEEVQPAEISELIAVKNPQQLASSLQQLALKWKELRGADMGETRTCRSSTSDSQLLRPATGTHPGATNTSSKINRRRLSELPRESREGPPCIDDRETSEPKPDIPTPAPTRRTKTPDKASEDVTGHYDKPQKPGAKLERYAGQGTSVDSFLTKFESHAKYFKWSEQDTVFQLKNSLTGMAAQVLWIGGENTTSAELIKLLHSQNGGKLQTERLWSELHARRRLPDKPLQAVCQDIRRLMYLASPHETGPLAQHISIDFYVAALSDPNMRMFVMPRDPVMLEDALNYSIRYEALLLGATEQTQPAVLDPASYVCDDKGRKKEPSVRAVEVQQYTKQQDLEKSLETQKA